MLLGVAGPVVFVAAVVVAADVVVVGVVDAEEMDLDGAVSQKGEVDGFVVPALIDGAGVVETVGAAVAEGMIVGSAEK